MDFDFSADQVQLRDAVRRWVDKGYDFERRKGIVAAGGFDRRAYAELAELGLCGLYVADEHGGLGMGPVEAMVAMEELGRGIVLEPLAHTLVSSGVLGACANQHLQADWLPRLACGEALVVLAHQERGLRYRLGATQTHATQEGDGWTVSGTKSVVPAGDVADGWLVPAQTDQGVALFLVAHAATGVERNGYLTQDGSRAAELRFSQTPAQLVTRDGQTALELAVDIGIAASSAYAIGVMDQTVTVTADYLNTRKQFGVPIASFQALRHRMADMKMQLELARSMSYYASLKLNAPTGERRQALARAKVQLGQSLRFVGQQAVQLHGGIGVTDEYIVSHYFKTLTQLEMTWGDTLHHLGEVSARMQESAGVFA
jgi:alkylation response protein AidB-like acyl-CoA dehydrogenase